MTSPVRPDRADDFARRVGVTDATIDAEVAALASTSPGADAVAADAVAVRARHGAAADGVTASDASAPADDQTPLPGPWRAPADPAFRTGTVPQLVPASGSETVQMWPLPPLPPARPPEPEGLEADDSARRTTLMSAAELLALFGEAPTHRAEVLSAPPPQPAERTGWLEVMLTHQRSLGWVALAFVLGLLLGVLAA